MITHYGLFWSERDVYWGKQNDQGELLGRSKQLGRRGAPTKEERKNSVDFRNYVGLYCLYGDGELLYVGEAGLDSNRTLFERLKEHRKGSLAGRWDAFSWFGRENSDGDCEVKSSLAQLEAIAIAIINPGFNKQGGTFQGATQIFQVVHEKAEGDMETKLERLMDEIQSLRPPPEKKPRGRPRKAKQA